MAVLYPGRLIGGISRKGELGSYFYMKIDQECQKVSVHWHRKYWCTKSNEASNF
jgi:hypothetical protein